MQRALLTLLLWAAMRSWAADPAVFSFSDPEAEARFQRLTQELRCLVCQNQSLADSHAELAGDLRREIHQMMGAGRSDEAIIAFMVERYGDFVRYRPPLGLRTFLLWFGPALLFLTGAGLLWRTLRRRGRLPPPALSAAERERVAMMLEGTAPSPPGPARSPPDPRP